MIVLITNCVLNSRTGTETFTRDLALALQDLGHVPVVYTHALGPIADEIQGRGIPVTDDISKINGQIDLIHGHHTLPTAIASIRFPQVPAIFVCHDFQAWHDTPPDMPSIVHYVALGRTSAKRLMYRSGVSEEQITVIPNGVDMHRFRPGPSLPAKPARALAFCRNRRLAGLIERACADRNLDLDVVGAAYEKLTDRPEDLMPQYDLIFASGRTAREALACERAVICCDERGLAGLITPEAYNLWDGNLGLASLSHMLTAGNLAQEIDAYDATAAQKAAALSNVDRSMKLCAQRYVGLYRSTLESWQARGAETATNLAMASLLQAYSPHKAMFGAWHHEREKLTRALARVQPGNCDVLPEGAPLHFGKGDAAELYCDLLNFHEPEHGHVWSDATRCWIRFNVPLGVSRISLRLHLSAIIPEGENDNTVLIASAARSLCTHTVVRHRPSRTDTFEIGLFTELELDLGPEDLEPGLAVLCLSVLRTVVPDPDPRRVGIDLRSIQTSYSFNKEERSDVSTESPKRPAPRRRLAKGLALLFATGAAVTLLVVDQMNRLPSLEQLVGQRHGKYVLVLGSDGRQLASRGLSERPEQYLQNLPLYVSQAFVAADDPGFLLHRGWDPLGLIKTWHRAASDRSELSGATLTQRLARLLLPNRGGPWSRRLRETLLTFRIAHRFTREQILGLYLERVPIGSSVSGLEAAAVEYFGVTASQLSIPQAAMLTAVADLSPRAWSGPSSEAIKRKAEQVIAGMRDRRIITAQAAENAVTHPAEVALAGSSLNYAVDYALDTVKDLARSESDLIVSTSIDPAMQVAGETALSSELDASSETFGVTQGALVAMDGSGSIKALIGGRRYRLSRLNRAVAIRRQPGSAFKPFVYLTALEHGLTPDVVRLDGPINVDGWEPKDYEPEYLGSVSLTDALSKSLNTVAVRLGLEVGPDAVAATAHRIGITSDLRIDPSIALGTSEVSLLELVNAYAVFGNGGFAVRPSIVTKVERFDGTVLFTRSSTPPARLVEPQPIMMMNSMLRQTLINGTGFRADLPGWEAAGKTGTSQDWRDAWFVGYTGVLVAGVWLGNDDRSPTRNSSGGKLPVSVWSRFMRTAHQGVPAVPLQGGIWQSRAEASQ